MSDYQDKNYKEQEGSRPKRPIRERLPYEDRIAPDEARALSAAERKTEKAIKDAEQKDMEVRSITDDIEDLMNTFILDYNIDTNLSGKERQRLFGAGVRNFGFIEKAYDIARENPEFLPRGFNAILMGYNIQHLEDARQLIWVLQQFVNAANEFFLKRSDIGFREALRIYGNLRELNRAKVPGADVLYKALLTYYRRRKPRPGEAEPTQKELERDFMKLIHGKADGDIEIINEQPHFVEGVRKVVDNVHTGHAAVRESAQAEIDEGTRK
jgi:hypothetical protein